MTAHESLHSDILVLGSGAAGLTAALVASAAGASVVLATKASLRASSSSRAQGGIAAAVAQDDSPALHGRDTLAVGGELCSPEAVAILVGEGPERVRWLEREGLDFDWEEGHQALGLEAGHSRRRVLHAGGAETGRRLIAALERQVRLQPRIRVLEHARAEWLLGDAGAARGAVLRLASGQAQVVHSPSVILATGGAAGLFQRTTNPPVSVGDGIALAYRLGAAVADVEFVQFHPTALDLPNQPAILVSEAVRGEGAWLLDRQGRRFMQALHPDAELAPRDIVARAIHAERLNGAVYLSLAHLDPEFVRRRFPNLDQRCLELGLNLARDPLPVAPAAHYFMGGVLTDLDGRSEIPGLFACGEVACTGVHGANRLASNSLLECLVFATRAVEAALQSPRLSMHESAAFQPHRLEFAPPTAERNGHSRDDFGPTLPRQAVGRDLPSEIGVLLDRFAGVVRDADGLSLLLEKLDRMESSVLSPEMADMALVARLIATAALTREESRGAHWRLDFPSLEPRFAGRLVQRLGQGSTLESLTTQARGAA